MDELDCPIHYGACLLQGTLNPRNLPRVYVDFRNVGLESLISYNDVAYAEKIREFHHEFILTGVHSPATWNFEIRVSFTLNEDVKNMEPSEFGALMGFTPRDND